MKDAVYTDADWGLVLNVGSFNERYELHHDCNVPGDWCLIVVRYKYRALKVPCNRCGSPVPDGLQGLYVMLTGDMET